MEDSNIFNTLTQPPEEKVRKGRNSSFFSSLSCPRPKAFQFHFFLLVKKKKKKRKRESGRKERDGE
jgi:hypothetical protein